MQRRSVLLGLAGAGTALAASSAFAQGEGARMLELYSPSRVLSVHLGFGRADIMAGIPTYEVRRLGRPVVAPSKLGFRLADAPDLQGDMRVIDSRWREADETWEQPWGEKRFIRNRYNELTVELQENGPLARRLDVIFRVYDDGVGFRYRFPEQPNLTDITITEELTEIAFADEATAWWIPARFSNRYEYVYRTTPLDEVVTAHTPITLRTKDGLHIAVHEAALVDYSGMALKRIDARRFQADLAP